MRITGPAPLAARLAAHERKSGLGAAIVSTFRIVSNGYVAGRDGRMNDVHTAGAINAARKSG
jgi:hypothetical protein